MQTEAQSNTHSRIEKGKSNIQGGEIYTSKLFQRLVSVDFPLIKIQIQESRII